MHAIRPIGEVDRAGIRAFLKERWGDELMVVHEEIVRPAELPGFVAGDPGDPRHLRGLVTYRIRGGACEIVTLDSLDEGRGVGSELVASVALAARSAGCRRLWLVTTNDNERAIAWYTRRGFKVCAVRVGAVDRARERKPSIRRVNAETGVPIRDEIELERLVEP